MARTKRKARAAIEFVDATPERIAKGDYSELVNPAEIDSSEQPIGLTRRFRGSRLDSLYKNGKITYRAKLAGAWFEGVCERATINQKLNVNLNSNGGGGVVFDFLPRTDAQEKAQALRAWALKEVPENMRGFLLRLCTRNELPSRHDRAGFRAVVELCKALEGLADSLKMPG